MKRERGEKREEIWQKKKGQNYNRRINTGIKKGVAANGIQPKSISLEAHVTESKKRNKETKGLSLLGCCLLLGLRTGCRLGHTAGLGRRRHLGLFNHGGSLGQLAEVGNVSRTMITYGSCCLARLGRVGLGLRGSLLLGSSSGGLLGGAALGGRLLLSLLVGLVALLGCGGLLGSSLGSSSLGGSGLLFRVSLGPRSKGVATYLRRGLRSRLLLGQLQRARGSWR